MLRPGGEPTQGGEGMLDERVPYVMECLLSVWGVGVYATCKGGVRLVCTTTGMDPTWMNHEAVYLVQFAGDRLVVYGYTRHDKFDMGSGEIFFDLLPFSQIPEFVSSCRVHAWALVVLAAPNVRMVYPLMLM